MKSVKNLFLQISLVILLFSSCYRNGDGYFIVSGQIECKVYSPGSTTGGRVIEVNAKEGDFVKKGDVLLKLDCVHHEAPYNSIQAKVKQAEILLEKLKKGATEEEIKQAEEASRTAEYQYKLLLSGAREEDKKSAKAVLDAAKVVLDTAQRDFERAERLYKEGTISKKQWEDSKVLYEKALGEYSVALERYNQLVAGPRKEEIESAKANWERLRALEAEVKRGPREEDIRSAEMALESAKAELERVKKLVEECIIVAPIDGVIETISLKVGDIAPPGPCIRMVDTKNLEMFVYVPAYVLGHITLGQDIEFTTDTYGDQKFVGRVVYIASEGEFTPRNLQTQEERIQQVFAVKLSVDSCDGKLKGGMTGTVRIPLKNRTN
ncbi:MAG: efflux RND transporter periplasmic adaptor subunit [Candidatus Hydrogenedentes bacterium]|nr:efflux RND transporter periplasmic adaptor subunit [Candidatus Hydrogenedentota bacterium]